MMPGVRHLSLLKIDELLVERGMGERNGRTRNFIDAD
jgi:hypothetical protein